MNAYRNWVGVNMGLNAQVLRKTYIYVVAGWKFSYHEVKTSGVYWKLSDKFGCGLVLNVGLMASVHLC